MRGPNASTGRTATGRTRSTAGTSDTPRGPGRQRERSARPSVRRGKVSLNYIPQGYPSGQDKHPVHLGLEYATILPGLWVTSTVAAHQLQELPKFKSMGGLS